MRPILLVAVTVGALGPCTGFNGWLALVSAAVLRTDVQQTPNSADNLAQAEARWKAHSPRAYQFHIQMLCGLCPPFPPGVAPPLFEVKGGVGVLKGNWSETVRTDFAEYSTVEAQFAYIRKQIAKGPARAELEFDLRLGHPVRIYFDPQANLSDDEFGFAVSALKPIL